MPTSLCTIRGSFRLHLLFCSYLNSLSGFSLLTWTIRVLFIIQCNGNSETKTITAISCVSICVNYYKRTTPPTIHCFIGWCIVGSGSRFSGTLCLHTRCVDTKLTRQFTFHRFGTTLRQFHILGVISITVGMSAIFTRTRYFPSEHRQCSSRYQMFRFHICFVHIERNTVRYQLPSVISLPVLGSGFQVGDIGYRTLSPAHAVNFTPA